MGRPRHKMKNRLPYYWAFIFGVLFFVVIKFGLRPAFEAIEWRSPAGEKAGHRLVHRADYLAIFVLLYFFILGVKRYFEFKRKNKA